MQFIYQHNEEFVCGDQKLKIQGKMDCCGKVVYDPAESTCCDGQLLTKQESEFYGFEKSLTL